MNDLWFQVAPCVVGLETTGQDGSVSMGTAFHIGDGFLITARHVVEGRTVSKVVTSTARLSVIHSITVPDDDTVDLALLSSDFSLDHYMTRSYVWGLNHLKIDAISLGGHLDDWIGDSMVMLEVLLLGFPPIPRAANTVLFAARGEINAVLDRYDMRPVHFVVSPTARGGFSGGPVVAEGGWLLGVVTDSLIRDDAPPEVGYSVAISVEPIYALLEQAGVAPRANRAMCYLFAGDERREAMTVGLEVWQRNALAAWAENFRRPEPERDQLGPASEPLLDGAPVWQAQMDRQPWTSADPLAH